MKRLAFVLGLALAGGLTFLSTTAWGGSFMVVVSGGALRVTARGASAAPVAAGSLILSGSQGMGDFGRGGFSGPTYLIVDATPVEAQVFLDGRLLGTARDLAARGLPMAPGRHAIEIVAPGFRPYVAQFTVAPGSFPSRFRVTLYPE